MKPNSSPLAWVGSSLTEELKQKAKNKKVEIKDKISNLESKIEKFKNSPAYLRIMKKASLMAEDFMEKLVSKLVQTHNKYLNKWWVYVIMVGTYLYYLQQSSSLFTLIINFTIICLGYLLGYLTKNKFDNNDIL